MKKIERYPVMINVPIIPKSTIGYIETKEEESPYYCKVLKTDLNEQEAYIKQLEERCKQLKEKLIEYTGVCVPDYGKTLTDVFDSCSSGCITCPQAELACKYLRELD